MSHKVEDVEQLIIDALKEDLWLGNKANVKIIDRYDGRFNAEDVKETLTGLPGLFVTYAADRLATATNATTYVQKNQFNVVVAASDLTGKFKAKQAALGITERVHTLLHKNELGLTGVFPPGLERENRIPQIIDKRIAVYEMTFNIKWVA